MYWRIWCEAIGLYRTSADFLPVFGSDATQAPIITAKAHPNYFMAVPIGLFLSVGSNGVDCSQIMLKRCSLV
jgi:hypothetical protein